MADHTAFKRAVALRGFAVGDFVNGGQDGQAVLEVARPTLDPAGRVHGVMLLTLNTSWLSDLSLDAALPDGASLFLVDQRGVVLARQPDDPDIVGRPLADDHFLRPILGSPVPGTAAGLARMAALVCSATRRSKGPARATGALVVVGIPESVAFEDVTRITREHLLGLCAASFS